MHELASCTLRTPLGDDVFEVTRMQGHETLNRPFQLELELASGEPAIEFEKVVGKPVTLELESGGGVRNFHGLVSSFSQTRAGLTDAVHVAEYRAVIVPWLWLMTRRTNCRIFQHKSVPEIVARLFDEHRFADYQLVLTRDYAPREYCVQYRESDFDFVSRLLEDEGINYFFTHEEDRHVCVVFDSPAGNPPCPDLAAAVFDPGEERPAIHGFEMTRQIRAGTWTLSDYDFQNPDLNLECSRPSSLPLGGDTRFEVFEYPGCYSALDQGDRLANLRMEAEEAASFEIHGASSCRELCCGHEFKLTEHERDDWNASYVLTRVEHCYDPTSEGATPYTNEFTCIPGTVPYRELPRTPRPVISGAQTATVVGASGREIDIDKYGRVIVQFHWDREGQRDQNSSCRVRVAQNWAGSRWGSVFHPRIGQEVIVEFLDGDPDRPIITGRVYNGKLLPPYDLPAQATLSGLRSRSSEGGDRRTFNELRFEDKKDSEEIYIHAQKDENIVVKHDKNEDVGHDETLHVANDRERRVDHDETLFIGNDQELDVGHDQLVRIENNFSQETGNQVRIVVGKSSITLNKDGTIIIDGVNVYVNGRQLSLRGRESFKYHSDNVTAVARTEHVIRGASVRHNP